VIVFFFLYWDVLYLSETPEKRMLLQKGGEVNMIEYYKGTNNKKYIVHG